VLCDGLRLNERFFFFVLQLTLSTSACKLFLSESGSDEL